MNVFIVHAHPEPQSLCSALRWQASEELRAQGHEVQVSDLHADGFNPIAGPADFGTRENPDHLVYAREQRQAYAAGTLAPDIQAELARLLWCDLLILNFPLWWFAPPALLKGWIDRVLIADLAQGGPRMDGLGGLVGKRAMLSLTLDGPAQRCDDPDSVHGPLDDMLHPLQRGTLASTGMAVLPAFVAWDAPQLARETILHACRQRLRGLDQLRPLPAPRRDDFDPRLHPRRAAAA